MTGRRVKGILFVLSGPSGSGKGAVRQALKGYRSDFAYSVSATTRAPRHGEENGRDYYFLDNDEFEKMIKANKLLEWANVYNYYYGTPREPVERTLNGGRDVILEIDVQGGLQVKKEYPQAVLVFILPPSPQELERRLNKRATDASDEIKTRLEWAKKEVQLVDRYDYLVFNEDIDETAQKIHSIMEAEGCRPWCQVLDKNWFDK